MTTLLAQNQEHLNWPEGLFLIALVGFLGVCAWLATKK